MLPRCVDDGVVDDERRHAGIELAVAVAVVCGALDGVYRGACANDDPPGGVGLRHGRGRGDLGGRRGRGGRVPREAVFRGRGDGGQLRPGRIFEAKVAGVAPL